ncbi:MAG: response regulator transcription factor [Bacteroidales bacterium]|nr:response regulator transcription factor [Bacteroidales bacterium]
MNVLIVEDEKSLSDEIVVFLKSEGYLCEQAFTGADASEKIAINLYDFVLLDLGLPDCDGLDIINNDRAWGSEPAFIIITARGEVQDKVKGLDLGADDYIAKPFALTELAARMQAVGRRKFKIPGQDMNVGEFVIEFQSRKVTHNDNEVLLTRKEFDLLNYLVINRNKVLTRQQLYEHIWGNILEDQYDSNFIDVHIKNVRRKLNEFASTPWLETVRGIGYRVSF